MTISGAAVVTGGARGIGKACVLALAEAGYPVVVADLDEEAGADVTSIVVAGGGRARFVGTDVTSIDDIRALMEFAETAFGRLQVLVNNAAVTRVIDLFDLTMDDWDEVLRVNARGSFFAMQEAARLMEASGGGSIVNMASIAAKGFRETSNVAYAASKGAIITMTRIAAARLGSANIRVNAVCPGMTKTQMWATWVDGRAAQTCRDPDALRAELAGRTALGRLNEPTDVAAAVVFLASEAARTITGQSLNVDGGTVWD